MSHDTPGPYVRLATVVFDDDKFLDIDDRGALLYVHSIVWSKGHGRDGFVPDGAVGIIAKRWGWPDVGQICSALLLAGLFTSEDGGYRIPSFEKWQVTKDRQREISAARREAGRLGGLATQEKAREETPRSDEATEANGKQVAWQTLKQSSSRRNETRRNETSTELSPKGDVAVIFDAWAQTLERPGAAKLTAKRQRLIRRAFGFGYSRDELIAAVTGWTRSAFHSGENSQGVVYNKLELILRDEGHIEQFRDFRGRKFVRPMSPSLRNIERSKEPLR